MPDHTFDYILLKHICRTNYRSESNSIDIISHNGNSFWKDYRKDILLRDENMRSVLGTEIIEGNIAYLEKEKDSDDVRIVTVGKFEEIIKIDKLNDFIKETWLKKEIKEELEFLITEAIIKWFKGIKYGYSYTSMFGDRILVGPFLNIEDAKGHQEKRRKSITKGYNRVFNKYPRIVKWDMKRYEYICTPEKRILKKPTEGYR